MLTRMITMMMMRRKSIKTPACIRMRGRGQGKFNKIITTPPQPNKRRATMTTTATTTTKATTG